MEIVNEILQWPVIIQGALGSFLFWLIFTLGQKTILFFSKKFKEENKVGGYFARNGRVHFYEGNYNLSNYSFFICIYAAIHYFLKFVLASFISFIISSLIPVFSYVGYVFAIYFLFRAMSYVPHFSSFENEKKSEENKEQK